MAVPGPQSPQQLRFRNLSAPSTPSMPVSPVLAAHGDAKSPARLPRLRQRSPLGSPGNALPIGVASPPGRARSLRMQSLSARVAGDDDIPAAELEQFMRFGKWACNVIESRPGLMSRLAAGEDLDAPGCCLSLLQAWERIFECIPENSGLKLRVANYFLWSANSVGRLSSASMQLAARQAGAASYLKLDAVASAVRWSSKGFTAVAPFHALFYAAGMWRDGQRSREMVRKARSRALKEFDRALHRMANPGKHSLADARARVAFIAACRKLPELSKPAWQDAFRAHASLLRDCVFLPVNLLASGLVQSGATQDWPVEASSAVQLIAALLQLGQGTLDVMQGARAELPRSLALREAARERCVSAGRYAIHHGEVLQADRALRAVDMAFTAHGNRVQATQSAEVAGAWLRIVKGLCMLAAALASLYTVAAQLREGRVLQELVALVSLSIYAVASLYYTGTGLKVRGRVNAATDTRNRQRLAQLLIATHTREQLLALVPDGGSQRLRVPRGKFSASSGFNYQEFEYEPARNEFLAMHVMALLLDDMLDNDWPASAHGEQRLAWLRDTGQMRETDLQDMLLVAQYKAPALRLDYLKQCLAPVFGTSFEVEADGMEREIKPGAVAEIAIRLCRIHHISTGEVDTPERALLAWSRIAPQLHRTIPVEQFIHAVGKVAREHTGRGIETGHAIELRVLRKLAKAASRERKVQLGAISDMGAADSAVLAAALPGRQGTALAAFCELVRRYAEAGLPDRAARLGILQELAQDALAQALIARPAILADLECGHILRALLLQVDRRNDEPGDSADDDGEAAQGGQQAQGTGTPAAPANDIPIDTRIDTRIDMPGATANNRKRLQRVATRLHLQERTEQSRGGGRRLAPMQEGGYTVQQD